MVVVSGEKTVAVKDNHGGLPEGSPLDWRSRHGCNTTMKTEHVVAQVSMHLAVGVARVVLVTASGGRTNGFEQPWQGRRERAEVVDGCRRAKRAVREDSVVVVGTVVLRKGELTR